MRTEWVESTAVAPLSTTLIYLFIEMFFFKFSFTDSITPGTFQIFLLKISSLLGTCSSMVHHGLIFVFLTNTEREGEKYKMKSSAQRYQPLDYRVLVCP